MDASFVGTHDVHEQYSGLKVLEGKRQQRCSSRRYPLAGDQIRRRLRVVLASGPGKTTRHDEKPGDTATCLTSEVPSHRLGATACRYAYQTAANTWVATLQCTAQHPSQVQTENNEASQYTAPVCNWRRQFDVRAKRLEEVVPAAALAERRSRAAWHTMRKVSFHCRR